MLWGMMPTGIQEFIYNLFLVLINLLYVAVPLCMIVWLSGLLIRVIKSIWLRDKEEVNIMQYLKKTINLYIVIAGLCSIRVIVWFNTPQLVVPKNLKIQEMTIRIEANENSDLRAYEKHEIKINKKEEVEGLVNILNQYACKRTSDFSRRISVNQGEIEILVVPANNQKVVELFWICVPPGNEFQGRRYQSANTSFTYIIQPQHNRSLSKEIIDYIDKNEK